MTKKYPSTYALAVTAGTYANMKAWESSNAMLSLLMHPASFLSLPTPLHRKIFDLAACNPLLLHPLVPLATLVANAVKHKWGHLCLKTEVMLQRPDYVISFSFFILLLRVPNHTHCSIVQPSMTQLIHRLFLLFSFIYCSSIYCSTISIVLHSLVLTHHEAVLLIVRVLI